ARKRLQDIESQPLVLKANLNGMPAGRFGEIVRSLRGRAQLDRRQKLIAPKSIQPGNEEGAQSAVGITLRNPGNSELSGNSGGVGVGLQPRGRDAIVAGTHFIDESRG